MNTTFYGPQGCPKCDNIGFKGRIGCYEVMDCTVTIKEMINKRATSFEIQQQAIKEGMITLLMAGKERVKQGITDIREAADLAS